MDAAGDSPLYSKHVRKHDLRRPPDATLFLAFVCLFVSAIGFKKTVYFISIGYGYSMAAMSVASPAICVTVSVLYVLMFMPTPSRGLPPSSATPASSS